MNKKIIAFTLMGIILIAGIVFAQVAGTPPTIPNGFILTMPNLPVSSGQIFGECSYNPSEMHAENIKVWSNDMVGLGSAQINYTFVITQQRCVKGFFRSVSYSSLSTSNQLINTVQQDFENAILTEIQLPLPETQPIATGNSPNNSPGSGGTGV